MKFFYIYKALAHPETNGYVAPYTLAERLLHVAEAKKKIGSRITWLCDTIDNDLKHALGDAPNSEFVIDPDGKIVVARRWSRPDELRSDLADLVGAVEPATTLKDVGMKRLAPPETAAKGIVPRLPLPGRMTPVRVRPLSDVVSLDVGGEPHYVKLRAEADGELLREGSGQLYLGFFLDPLYAVHWNNRVAPIEFSIETSDGCSVTPREGQGPQVEQDADADPREFLVDIEHARDEAISVTIKYFACDDAETFCKPVTQRYEVVIERDRDGGSRRSRRGSGEGAARRAEMMRPFPGPAPGARRRFPQRTEAGSQRLRKAVAMFKRFDANQDGTIDAGEAGRDRAIIQADVDGDDGVSLREVMDWLKNQ